MVLVLTALAVWGVIVACKAAVDRIAESGLEEFCCLSFSFRDIQKGIGDIVFYSLPAGTTFINVNLITAAF